VQVAAYNTQDKATQLLGRLDGLGAKVMSGSANGQTFYRVRIGPLASSAEAASTLARVKALGFAEARYVSEAAAPATPAPLRSGAPALRLSDNSREPQ
jgi:rare lipoprotein A